MGQALSQESNVPITRYVYRVQIPNTRERSGVAWLLPSSRRRCSAAKTELVRSEHNSEPSGDRAAAATGTAEAVPHPGWTRMRTQGFVAVERLLALCALGIALGLCISAFRGPAHLQGARLDRSWKSGLLRADLPRCDDARSRPRNIRLRASLPRWRALRCGRGIGNRGEVRRCHGQA